MYEQNMRIIDRHLGSLSRASHPQYIPSSTGNTTGVGANVDTSLPPPVVGHSVQTSPSENDFNRYNPAAHAHSSTGTNNNNTTTSIAQPTREKLARDRLMQSNVQIPFERHLWNEPPLTRHVRQLYKFHTGTTNPTQSELQQDMRRATTADSEDDDGWIDGQFENSGVHWTNIQTAEGETDRVDGRAVEDEIVALDDAYLGDLGPVEDPSYLYYA